jgi:YegS/Rv2252/BmrU family lipid kinase
MRDEVKRRGEQATRRRSKIEGDAQEPSSPRLRVGTPANPLSSLIPHPSSLPLVIVNPASAGGTTGAGWARAACDLRAHFGAFQCAFTKGAGDAREMATCESRDGRRLIIACGGDGTISEVACGIIESGAGAELGILPSGTGGDFRRTLRLPTRTADAARALREGRTVLIDAGRVEFRNRGGETESRYFVNVASCGMGGEVIRRVEESGEGLMSTAVEHALGGRVSYAVASARAALSFEKPRLRVSLDGKNERRIVMTNLCVANARYFGGGMKIAPRAKLTDGLFDVIAVGDMDALTIFKNAYKLYLGTHLGMTQVSHARARRIDVRPDDESIKVLLEVDGELVGSLPATFEILPRALRVRAPRQESAPEPRKFSRT